ncbi:hypothetical protein D4A92_10455 [Rhizobium rosettiformans]|uniref:DUF2007 domain-containing protein n=1 Tax=Rhizobium rosettiformans TaxID=1368430 RepID=A0ABX7EWS1_9HYPH|nr:hypothetical protein [Rhizobium rosettiformans]QRF51827.1 hypothetical protein D4A92_10455 [Rhizobium rosettiformans]
MAELRDDALVRVARVFNAADFAVTRSYLAAHDILIAAEPIHMLNNYSHYASALGGCPILVPARQATDALHLLTAVGEPGQDGRRGPFRWLAYILLFGVLCGLSVAPPSSGRVIHCRRTAVAQGLNAV